MGSNALSGIYVYVVEGRLYEWSTIICLIRGRRREVSVLLAFLSLGQRYLHSAFEIQFVYLCFRNTDAHSAELMIAYLHSFFNSRWCPTTHASFHPSVFRHVDGRSIDCVRILYDVQDGVTLIYVCLGKLRRLTYVSCILRYSSALNPKCNTTPFSPVREA